MKKVHLNLATVTMQDLTQKEGNLYNREVKKVSKLRTDNQLKHHVHNANKMKNQRNGVIILMAVVTIKVIKAKLGMSNKELMYIDESEAMYKAQIDNTKGFFTPAFSGLADWLAANVEFRAALKDVRDGVIGGEGRKVAAKTELDLMLKLALGYVNAIVLKRQANALEIIQDARMVALAEGTKNVADLRIIPQEGSGSVKLMSIAFKVDGKKVDASYEFAYSADNGETWIHICTIPKASFIVTNLPTNIPLLFRKRVTPGTGIPTVWVVSKPTLVN